MSAPVSTYVLIEALSIASLAAVSYVSTNLDNLELTFDFVCFVVLVVSLALARAADSLPTVDIRYSGLIPLTLGAYQLVQLTMGQCGEKAGEPDKTPGPIGFAAYFGSP